MTILDVIFTNELALAYASNMPVISYSNRKVFLIGFWPDYERIFFSKISIPDYVVEVFDPMRDGSFINGLKFMPRLLRNLLFKQKIRSLIKNNPDAIFILHEHRVALEAILGLEMSFACAILFRNPIAGSNKILSYLERLKQRQCMLWSFDRADCEEYGLNYYQQFIGKYDGVESINATHDFGFVGRDKGRKDMLLALSDKLRDMGYSVQLNIRSVDKSAQVPYQDYLMESCSARCIIDIVQEGQSGTTLRPLEGMLYRRKVLTNNASVKELNIFRPDNIFILDETLDLSGIDDFMKSDFFDLPMEEVLLHHPNQMIQEIITAFRHR